MIYYKRTQYGPVGLYRHRFMRDILRWSNYIYSLEFLSLGLS